jgi:hypothetical protein
VLKKLLVLPRSGELNLPNGFSILKRIVMDPKTTHAVATDAIYQIRVMARLNREEMKKRGREVMEIIARGESAESLIIIFSLIPEMYLNDPSCLNDNLNILFKMKFLNVATLFRTISQKHPEVLVPYLNTLIKKMIEDSKMTASVMICIKEVAKYSPDSVYPMITQLRECGLKQTGGAAYLAEIMRRSSEANVPDASENILNQLIDLLDSADTASIPYIFSEISNTMRKVDPKVLQKRLPEISKHKAASATLVQDIVNFAAGYDICINA